MADANSEPPPNEFVPVAAQKPVQAYTDGRVRWDWKSHFPPEARSEINLEAWTLGLLLVVTLAAAGTCLGVPEDEKRVLPLGSLEVDLSFRLLAIFFTGCVGGTTFSIKWLIHSVAKGTWHLDRRYWRFLVPAIGGVYACVVLTLSNAGLFSRPTGADLSDVAGAAALAFLVGYFSDGVSGLLSNVANAVFGTLEKK